MVTVPVLWAVTRPRASTDAIVELEELHRTVWLVALSGMTVGVRVAVYEVSSSREISVVSRLTPVTATVPSGPGIPTEPS
jgi:hypothetical protein